MKEEIRIYKRTELDDLINKEHSCIVLKECKRKVELEAKYLKDVKQGIKEALDKGLNKFDYSLNGILLDYRRVKILTDEWNGRIIGRFGEFLVTVQAHFYVFHPKIGSFVEGIVHTKSDAHIGILVHKIFNAMILKSNIDGKWNFEDIMIDDKVIFSIIDHIFSGHVPFIEGALTSECSLKRSKKKRKKHRISCSQVQELRENGDVTNEKEMFSKEHEKSEVDNELESNLDFIQQEDMENFTHKSQKSTSDKKLELSNYASMVNVMEVDEPMVKSKKKKKQKGKEKKKDGDILQTECNNSHSFESTAKGNSVFLDGAIIPVAKDGKSLKTKKKKDKKHVTHPDEPIEKFDKNSDNSELTVQKTKEECILKEDDLEIKTNLKQFKKRHNKEKDFENIEEAVQKSTKKKRKHEKEKSTEHKDISHSDNKSNSADTAAEICDPAHFIDELMNIVPMDVISRGETSPMKGTNFENLTGPKLSNSENVKKLGEERFSPNKKKRDESLAKNTTARSMMDVLEASPSKKRRLEKSLLSSKSNDVLEESLFSDVEVESTPVLHQKPAESNVLLSKRKPEDIKEEAEKNEDTLFKKLDNKNKKDKKMKKAKDKSVEKKLKESCPATGTEFHGSINISPVDKDKNESQEKKSLPENNLFTENPALSPSISGQQSTLLQRFKECLLADVNISTGKSPEKNVKTDSPIENTKGLSLAKEKVKKTVAKQVQNKLNVTLRESTNSTILQPKCSELNTVDSMLSVNPVVTSTPKETVKSEKIGKNNKKRVKKIQNNKGNKDKEREEMIRAIMLETMKSFGLDDSVSLSKENSHSSSIQTSVTDWLDKKKSKKSPKKKAEQSDTQH